jgi:hypothetical protein
VGLKHRFELYIVLKRRIMYRIQSFESIGYRNFVSLNSNIFDRGTARLSISGDDRRCIERNWMSRTSDHMGGRTDRVPVYNLCRTRGGVSIILLHTHSLDITMKLISFASVALTALSASTVLARSISINYPTTGVTIFAGKNFTVGVERPVRPPHI